MEIPLPQTAEIKKGTLASQLQIPRDSSYSGAYIDFGDREDNVTLESIQQFDSLVGKQQAIIAFSSDWGNQSFPLEQLNIIYKYGALPLVYWSPWDRPVNEEGTLPPNNRFNLDSILSGTWDAYIDSWATGAREVGRPIFVSWGLEMNGNWFPWSGVFAGANSSIPNCPKCSAGPEKFKATYKYVVDRVRRANANNIIWVWHVNNTSDPDEPWNSMQEYYPGSEYADWLAMSAYGQQYPQQGWVPTSYAFDLPYAKLSKVDSNKPIMLAEWGIGEFPASGDKAAWITEAMSKFKLQFTRIKAIVVWHERWQNSDLLYSNLRINSSAASLKAYKQSISDSYWLSRPLLPRDMR